MELCGFTEEFLKEKAVMAARLMQLESGPVFMDHRGNFTSEKSLAVIAFVSPPWNAGAFIYAVNLSEMIPGTLFAYRDFA